MIDEKGYTNPGSQTQVKDSGLNQKEKPINKSSKKPTLHTEERIQKLQDKTLASNDAQYVVPFYHVNQRFHEISNKFYKADLKQMLYSEYMSAREIGEIVFSVNTVWEKANFVKWSLVIFLFCIISCLIFLVAALILWKQDDTEDIGLIILLSMGGLAAILAIFLPFLYPRCVTNQNTERRLVSATRGILEVENDHLKNRGIKIIFENPESQYRYLMFTFPKAVELTKDFRPDVKKTRVNYANYLNNKDGVRTNFYADRLTHDEFKPLYLGSQKIDPSLYNYVDSDASVIQKMSGRGKNGQSRANTGTNSKQLVLPETRSATIRGLNM